VLGGFLIASAVAVPLGIVMGAFKPVEALLEPLISFARYLPASAFIPLLILWARWADSTGEVSRWSKPCVARLEGWTSSASALPPGDADSAQCAATKVVFIQPPYELAHQPRELIDEAPALLEARMKMLTAA
jgi:ABC-type proline/glycine betaine transport system permease subunit